MACFWQRLHTQGMLTTEYVHLTTSGQIGMWPALIEKTPALRASMSQPCGAIVTNQDKYAQCKLIKI
jgi:hypothetical protein